MSGTIREQLQALVNEMEQNGIPSEGWVILRLEAILAASQPTVSVKAGWVCKSAIGVQWTDTKPEWFESYGWSCFDEALIVDECITDPWAESHPNGGPECCIEVK